MASEERKEVVEFLPGLTARSIAITIPLALLWAFLSVIVGLYTDKPGTFGTFILPMIYLVVIFEALGRVNPKLRLSPQEWVFMFTVFTFMGMHSYLTMHAAAHNNPVGYIWSVIPFGDYLAFSIADLRDYWSKAVPAVVIPPEPLRFEVANMLVNGRSPGQPIPWGAVLAPLLFWGVAYIFYTFTSIFVVFTIGRPWVEEERLVFPLAIPSLYLFREAGEVSPGTNKARLFDLSIPATKVFWAMFVVGIISGINPILAELLPAFPIAAWWGETKLDLPFLAAVWPGIYASAIFFLPQIAVGLIMPNDVLITLIIGWIIFGVLYQGIGVAIGAIPYRPGMEYVWPWEDYPGIWMPFPYRLVGANGIALAIIIWILVRYRRRIAEVISTLWKRDIVEQGISLRIPALLLFIGCIGMYVMLLIEGADPIVALLIPAWAVLFNFLYARVFAEVFWHVGNAWGDAWDLFYQVGRFTRGWPPPDAVTWDNPLTDPSWFTIARWFSNLGNWNISFSPLSAGHQVTLYKLAHDLRMRMRDFLIALIIGILVVVFVAMPFEAYMLLHTKGGMSAIGQLGTWWPWSAAGYYHRGRWFYEGITPEMNAGLLFGFGILLGLVLYVLKARFTWFWFINVPALYVSMTIVTYMWLTSLIALIIKYVAIRTVGMRRYEEYAMPVVAGWILGFGAAWLPAAIVNLFAVVIPKCMSMYLP